jgi:hypothetical protein
VRSSAQIRLEASFHEGGHATAMWLLGVRIDHLELMRPDEVRADGLAGCVQQLPTSIDTIGAAIDQIVIYFAGESAFRTAWAAGTVSDDDIGGGQHDTPIEVMLASPNGASPGIAASFEGWLERPNQPDEVNARSLAEHKRFTSSLFEAELLLKFARARTASMVDTPRFLSICGDLAGVLREHAPLEGADAEARMGRTAYVYDIGQRARDRQPEGE